MSAKLSGHQESPEISGLLYKKRGGFGKMMPNCWQYRFFILSKDGILTYYDTEVPGDKDIFEGKERGRLDLRGVKYDLATESTEGAPTQYIIIIQPEEGEKWKLCADTKEDHARWWRLIEKFIPENSERSVNTRPSLNIQSDDDYEGHNTISPSNYPRNKKISKFASQSVDGETRQSPSVPVSPQNAQKDHQSLQQQQQQQNFKNEVSPTPSKKNRLKVARDSGLISQEWVEWVMVMAILNICIYAVVKDNFHLDQVFYCLVMNAIVAHTLTLRAHRVTKAAAEPSAAPQVNNTWMPYPSRSTTSNVGAKGTHLHATAPPAPGPHVHVVGRSQHNDTTTSLASLAASGSSIANASSTDSTGAVLVKPGAKPLAGFTLKQVFTEPKLSPDHTWCKADHRQFNVRVGPDYNRHKKKAPSAAPIYEAFAVDVFCTKLRADHCSPRFQLLDPASRAPINVDTGHPWVPPVFVIQIQIPSDPPSGFFTSAEDGPGWAILMYYRITEDTLNQLKDLSTASAAVKLFAEWCEKCTEDAAWRGRFKVINSCTNLDEMGIPSAISSYNAKPILIRRTGSIYRGVNDGVKYMEMNIHVHKFATLAKQSIHYISSRCGQMYMQIGFVIEGREDSELPETMFACVAVNKPQEELAEFIFEEEEEVA